MKLKPQTEAVLRLMRERGSLSQREAIDLAGVYRLAPRVKELRDVGHEIETLTEPHKRGTHARYVLIEQGPTEEDLEAAGQLRMFS